MANEDTSTLSDEVSGLKAEIKAEISKIADSVKEFVRTHGQDAAARIQGTAEETWTGAKQKLDCVSKKIHEEPVAATAVAFGIGLLIGLIFFGRRR
jgi:ElaB/YqjD/DUF883 family membrane-anchored ribosome-binding protein